MASSYTSLLGLVLPVTGELQGTWGSVWNDNGTSYIDAAIAGTQTLSTDADVTLTKTTNASLSSTSSQYSILLFSGARTAQRTVTVPAASKIYTVINATTGGYAVKVVASGPTTGITIANGESAVIAWNGSDFIKISNTGGAASFTNVTISGTTTLSGLTASTALALDASKNVVSVTNTGTGNNVLSASPTLTGTVAGASLQLSSLTSGRVTYAGASGLLQDSASLTFDGTTLTAGGFATGGSVTLSGGTANGVLYLNGSKVATSGTALTFDGTNFGIGLSASSPLEVQSNSGGTAIRIRGRATANTGTLRFYANDGTTQQAKVEVSDNTFEVGSITNVPFVFNQNGTEQMRLTSTGLGIGTSSPSNKLHVTVSAASTAVAAFYNTDTANGNGVYIKAGGSNSGKYAFAIDNAASTSLLLLDSSGNLGIGTSSPGSKLDVAGSAVAQTINDTQAYSYGTSGPVLAFQGLDSGSTKTQFASLKASPASANPDRGFLNVITRINGVNTTTLQIGTGLTGDILMPAGNLGIGTSSPATRLSVDNTRSDTAGTGWFTYTNAAVTSGKRGMRVDTNNGYWFDYYNGSSWSAQLGLDSSGNLGLGVTPSSWDNNFKAFQLGYPNFIAGNNGGNRLDIGVNAYFSTNYKYAASSVPATYYSQSSGAHIWYNAASGTAGNAITFTQAMTLDASGQLGIGTSSPSAKLNVVGTGDMSGIFESTGTINAASLIVRSGNGTTSGLYAYARFVNNDTNAQDWRIGTYGTNNLSIVNAKAGTTPVVLDSSGNLGLGVTPSAWYSGWKVFEIGSGTAIWRVSGQDFRMSSNLYNDGSNSIYKANGAAAFYNINNGTHIWQTAPSGTAGNAITFTQAMTLDASGNLGLGTGSPNVGGFSRALSINRDSPSNGSCGIDFLNNGTAEGYIFSDGNISALIVQAAGSNTYSINFKTGGTERARIDSSGNLLVGTTSTPTGAANGSALYSNGQFATSRNTTSSTTHIAFYNPNGIVGSIDTSGSSTSYNTSSDYRLKDNPQPLTGSGAFIDALKPKTWTWKADGSKGVGFIAHEVQEISPNSVVGEKDGEQMQAMEYGSAEFIANIIAELQQLRARVAQLEKGN